MSRRGEAGVTLVEVVIVSALAMLVVLGMVGFYISSQSSWMAGSSQALAQRDATLLVATISESVRGAAHAEVIRSDTLHHALLLRDAAREPLWCFWWDATDSRVHQGPAFDEDHGPVVGTPVTRFQLDTLTRLVDIRLIELRADDGQVVRVSSAATLYNRGEAP